VFFISYPSSRGLPSSFIYVVVAAGQDPGRAEDPTVTEDQLQKMQIAEYEMQNSIIAGLNEKLVLSD